MNAKNPFVKLIAIFVGLLVIAICQQIFFNSSAVVAFATLGVTRNAERRSSMAVWG
jgi:hypothetical protein